jgi:hypothetical protein
MQDEFARKYDTAVVAATVEPMETTAPLAERLDITYPVSKLGHKPCHI